MHLPDRKETAGWEAAINSDVRMRGFENRATVEFAIAWIDSRLATLLPRKSEVVPLLLATDRILAEDIVSPINVPGFRRSMMDGYALRAEATSGASSYNPLTLQIIGDSFPGHPFVGQVGAGQAVRIMTGAPIPDGADAVLPCEQCEAESNRLTVHGEVSPGKHVGAVGEDVRQGTTILSAGRKLRPQDLGVLSSIGRATVPVICRPKVEIVITGNELLESGSLPFGHKIADANGPMLAALVARDGGHFQYSGIIGDDREAIFKAMQQNADVILVSGGSSVGQEDHAPSLLASHGTLAVHGVAMRPSSPAGMGWLGNRLVFLLPGNPVSCLCAYDFFAGRAIRVLGGRPQEWPYRSLKVTLSRKLVSTVGRVDYARVKLNGETAEPISISGASILTSTTVADGFVIVPSDSEGYPAYSVVDVWLY